MKDYFAVYREYLEKSTEFNLHMIVIRRVFNLPHQAKNLTSLKNQKGLFF